MEQTNYIEDPSSLIKTNSSDDQNKEEEIYPKIKSKIEILDILFHPSENKIINAGLINGKLKM